jgi:hypothetical protein
MYWTAVNYETQKYGKLIWSKDNFEIWHWEGQDRLYLYKGKYQLAELISGTERYKKQYQCDPKKWIRAVRKKDLKKVEKIRFLVNNALKEAKFIESLWV